jgi:hypothetical protein
VIPLPCSTGGKFKPNSGCPCDRCQHLQRRYSYGEILAQLGAPYEGSLGWKKVHDVWDKIRAWEETT